MLRLDNQNIRPITHTGVLMGLIASTTADKREEFKGKVKDRFEGAIKIIFSCPNRSSWSSML